jgi:hypothetical protein
MTVPLFSFRPEGRRLRRKLQKINTHQKCAQEITMINNAKIAESRGFNSAPPPAPRRVESHKPVPRELPSRPAPPDVSIYTRSEYQRTSGYAPSKDMDETPPQSPSTVYVPPSPVIPEFAYLNVCRPRSRGLSETISSDGPSTPPSEASSITLGSRRYAKTPVTSIGQLESRSLGHTVHKVPSVELIAQSYRALLESRCSFLEERFHDALETLEEEPYESEMDYCIHEDELPVETIVETTRDPQAGMGSPTSSDGTLVGFEEDTIYFKPIPIDTPEPFLAWSRLAENRRFDTLARTATPADNPSLQIMTDLLVRELSAVAQGSQMRPTTETSALQIWVMIEAYEKLRDQVDRMRLDPAQARSVQDIFGTWIQALYTVHDNLAGSEEQMPESDYEDMIPEGVD